MKPRHIWIAGASLAVASATITAAALALPDNAFEYIYYSDASKTVVVGDMSYMCGPQVHSSGQRTPYWDYISYGPCDPLPPVDDSPCPPGASDFGLC